MSDLIFDASTHTYSVDGKIVPSVTQIIQAEGIYDMSNIPKERLETAWKLGTAVHLATEYEDKGILDPESIDPVVLPYLEQWRKFKADFDFELLSSEQKLYSKKYGYAGTLDRTCCLRMARTSRRCVIDIKTGLKTDVCGIQLSAYLKLLEEHAGWNKRDCMVAVFITPDKYEMKVFSGAQYFSLFISAMNLYKYKERL